MQTNNQVKPDEFRVGDTVWCLVHGKGEVSNIVSIMSNSEYPVDVCFENGNSDGYTLDGKLFKAGNRTLFFSEPKIEASVTRPFVPTLVGKRVVVKTKTQYTDIATVHVETADEVYTSSDGDFWRKSDLEAIYEVQSENLLKKD